MKEECLISSAIMYMKNYRKSGKFEQPEENEDGKTAEFLSNFTVCCRQNLHHFLHHFYTI